MTFKGEEKIKTPLGACLTIFFFVFLAGFALLNAIKLNTLMPPIQTKVVEGAFYDMHSELDANELV